MKPRESCLLERIELSKSLPVIPLFHVQQTGAELDAGEFITFQARCAAFMPVFLIGSRGLPCGSDSRA